MYTINQNQLNSALSRIFDALDGCGWGARNTVREWLDQANSRPGEISDKAIAMLDILSDLGFDNEVVVKP